MKRKLEIAIRIFIYIIVSLAVFISLILLFRSCAGCGEDKTEIAESGFVFFKKDSTDQIKIDSLSSLVDQRGDSIAVLNYRLDEIEKQRHEIIVTTRTKLVQVGIESADVLYKQNRFWLSPGRPLNLKSKLYQFDSLDQLSMAKKHIENEFLIEDNRLLTESVDVLTKKVSFLNYSLSDEKLIAKHKDDQIQKLESTPVQIVKRKWYIDACIIAGSFALGYMSRDIIRFFKKLFSKK